MLIDEVVVTIKAGNGGNGAISFKRNAQTSKGGPDGGNGGKGGDIYFRGINDITALSEFRYKKRVFTQKGGAGEEKKLLLELKLIADIGLIGLPNSGKSSLLSVLTNAHPKIGNYPFTTLEPNLGVMDGLVIADGNNLVIADIPGLIEGASNGKGLGDKFLRHIERTKILVHCIDGLSENI